MQKALQCRQTHGTDSSVRTNDVIFALHAATMTALTLFQCAIYDRGQQRVSALCKVALCGVAVLVTAHGLLAAVVADVGILSWLYMLSWVKLFITISKYIPQVFTFPADHEQMMSDLARCQHEPLWPVASRMQIKL